MFMLMALRQMDTMVKVLHRIVRKRHIFLRASNFLVEHRLFEFQRFKGSKGLLNDPI